MPINGGSCSEKKQQQSYQLFPNISALLYCLIANLVRNFILLVQLLSYSPYAKRRKLQDLL
jgi:hypothetical protein